MRTASSFRLMALSLLASAAAYAQGATVVEKTGHGEAAIVKGDEAKAFEEAKQQALRAAVEQAAGVRIEADTLTVNNQLVRDQILANTAGYVKSFDVTAKKAEKGVLAVDVKAQIVTENLEKDVAAARSLVKRMGRPTIVIAIQEQTTPLTSSNIITTDFMSKFLGEALQKDGWTILDPAGLDKDFKLGAAIASGDAQAVKNVGALTKANFVVYGSAAFRHQDPGDANKKKNEKGEVTELVYYPVTGEYGLNIFTTDNGVQIGRIAGSVGTSDKTRAGLLVASFERSTQNILQLNREDFIGSVRKAVLEHLRNAQMNGVEVSLSVTGLPNIGAVKEFGDALGTLKGVKSAQFLNDFRKGTASYRVTFAGEPSELATAVEAATFKKKKLEVVGVTSNTMEVAIGK